MTPKIEVKTKGIETKIFIDGQEMKKVRAIHFTHEAREIPVLSLEFVGADLYLDGEFVPALPAPFENWYKAKTPPEMGEALQKGGFNC